MLWRLLAEMMRLVMTVLAIMILLMALGAWMTETWTTATVVSIAAYFVARRTAEVWMD